MNRDKRIKRWQRKYQRTAGMLDSWRTPRNTKLLIVGIYSFLALVIISGAITAFIPTLAMFPILFIICTLVPWIMLSIVIGHRDSAPEEILDEYEQSVLQNWRAASYKLLSSVTFLELFVLSGLSEWNPDELHRAIALNAVLLALAFLVIMSLPTVAYALHLGPVPARHSQRPADMSA